MKFGIEVPINVNAALLLDEKNGNHLWEEAIKKEMKNARVAFQLLGKEDKPPPGYKQITCHLIYDVKMDLTSPPFSLTYASVITRNNVRLGFLIAALNNLDILAGDVQNAYLNAPTKEKVYFTAGNEWKADEGRIIIIVRAL